ncbi:MAG TPA: glutaredoxin family protein [Candidatus Competibacteraceae bacterium]|nr:glutaredoxin family protein [Candidatus Competibacteraceae bacterium]
MSRRYLLPCAEQAQGELLMYSTTGCHLCEQAQALLVRVLGRPAREVEIADDEVLLERYGVRIPVLRRANGDELGWPFDESALRRWLGMA